MLYISPNRPDSKIHFKPCYGNFVGGFTGLPRLKAVILKAQVLTIRFMQLGDYKKSGIGRENRRIMPGHYQQKVMLISYDINPLDFF